MINRNDYDIISLIYKLRAIESIIAEDDADVRIRKMLTLFEDEQYTDVLAKRFPLCPDRQELLSLLSLPKENPQRVLKLYTRDKVVYHCRHKIDMHTDQCCHVLFTLSGDFNCSTDTDGFTLRESHICVFSPGVPHAYAPVDAGGVAVSLLIEMEFLQELLLDRLSGNTLLISFFSKRFFRKNIESEYILVNATKAIIAQNMLYLGLAEYLNRSLCYDEVINSFVILFFLELMKTYMIESDTINFEALNNHKGSDIIAYIDDHCGDITLVSTAEHFHFHPNYFSGLIKSYTGESFTSLVQSARMKKSCMFLKHDTMPISQIAALVGYQDSSYYYRLFKQFYGMTPKEYRQVSIQREDSNK